MGQELVVRDGDTLTRRGFDFLYLHQGWYHNQLGTLMLQTGGRYVAEDGTTVTVNEPEAVEALQIWYDMIYEYKIADPNVASREATVPYQDFLDGKVAMTLINPWGMGLVTAGVGRLREVRDRAAAAGRPGQARRRRSTPTTGRSTPRRPTSASGKRPSSWSAFLASAAGPVAEERQLHPADASAGTSCRKRQDFPFFEVWAARDAEGPVPAGRPRRAQEIDNIMQQTIESSVLTGVPPQEALDAAATADRGGPGAGLARQPSRRG